MEDDDSDEVEEDIQVHSVDFDGDNLVAGEHGGNAVWYSDDPTDSSPTVSTTRSLKRPGGPDDSDNNVTVAFANSDVVAGTTGEESAFARSTNMGQSFNDVSLIDTEIDLLGDVTATMDGETMYLASVSEDNAGYLSIWRSASDFERILSIDVDDWGENPWD
jgi:hypothetical protein